MEALSSPARELRADPEEISRLASATLDLSTALSGSWRAASGRLVVPSGAGGGVDHLRAATETVAAAAGPALRRLAEVYAGDADRLWRTAFAYEEADGRAAGWMLRAGQVRGAA
ncbi:hypothetical protein [Hamadaea tsunoensis]|uniref:hypothetical protein n=1 Tax=Hamadaea tsunoensis TaxID=53368 RepID=UPI0012FC7B1C|nr:hypothetical protein [Hamadaea tsunoensis]